MKVVAFNGSPKKEGNTYHAIKIVTDELTKAGIETEIIQVGHKPVRGCLACGKCIKNQDEKCSQSGDDVNEWIQKIKIKVKILKLPRTQQQVMRNKKN